MQDNVPDDLLLDAEMAAGHLAEVGPGGLGELHNPLHLEVETLADQVRGDVVKLALHGEPEEHLHNINTFRYLDIISTW